MVSLSCKKVVHRVGLVKRDATPNRETSRAASGAEGVEDLMMLSKKQPVPFCLLLLEEQKSQASFIYS